MHKLNIFLLIVLAIALQVALIVGIYKIRQPKPEPPRQETAQPVQIVPEFVVDPYITQLGSEVGISKEKLVELKASFVDSCSPVPDTLACYNGDMLLNNQIKQRDRLKQRVALAHEYLHYVWNKKADKIGLKPLLSSVYIANKAYFDSRFVNYYNNGTKVGDENFYNELHSFVGTEVSDNKLSPELLHHYMMYTNREALPSYI